LPAFLGAERRVAPSLVVVRRKRQQPVAERQQLAEQTVVKRLRIAGGKIGPAGPADEQGVAGQDPIGDHQADRVVGVSRRLDDSKAELADDQRLAVLDP
jgi:hypothetical protein